MHGGPRAKTRWFIGCRTRVLQYGLLGGKKGAAMSLLKHFLLNHRYLDQTRVSLRWLGLVLAAAVVVTVFLIRAVW